LVGPLRPVVSSLSFHVSVGWVPDGDASGHHDPAVRLIGRLSLAAALLVLIVAPW
jgi:hypothetical protein